MSRQADGPNDRAKDDQVEKDQDQADPVRAVRSDLAEPSRPHGYHGVRQPIEANPPATSGDGPASDDALASLVSGALKSDGRLADQAIRVACARGVVTLSGEVALEFQRTLAAAVVEALPQVLLVENRLRAREVAAEVPGTRPSDDALPPGAPTASARKSGPSDR
ncbi:hypothetical protein AL036_05605 [Salipiger aestuarii]|uniref:BON domain-containing protein n=1 Tax=Salipiger aestuarii TaxID=568098 RepID=UPI001239CC66|nr:BON domain-containing protein [Salipiger aestuarii]KAA8608888.1 hypothetical protein AL036_05605 [Salipiger aestuarii]